MKPSLSHSAEETEAFAASFSKQLIGGDCLALCGDLGSGKTTFVRGLFEGMGGSKDHIVHSPTFTLLHEYPTQRETLYHFDLYRLSNYREFEEIDFESYLGGHGICVIEWGDKFPELTSRYNYVIHFDMGDGNLRHIRIDSIENRTSIKHGRQ